MNVSIEQQDSLNAVVKIEVKPEDYKPHIDEVVKKYQRTAQVPGFRPGKVPVGVIKKMYGKALLADELNKLLSDSLNGYIREKQLDVIGTPLPLKSSREQVLEEGNSFEFSYELGLAPQFEVTVSANDQLPYYLVKVDDKMVEDDINDLRRRYGKFSNPETSEAHHILYGDFVELDETGSPKPEGNKTTTTLSIEMIKDAIDRNQFVGLKNGDHVDFNPMKVLAHEAEVAAMLKTEKDSPAMHSNYRFTVRTINQIEKAELTQEFFDKIYGEGVVKNEEELRNKVREDIARHFERESERKLKKDVKNYFMNKLSIPLPDEFLKRSIKAHADKESVGSDFDHEYYHLAEDLRWELIVKKLAGDYQLTVSEEELKGMSKMMAQQQFARYGYYDVDEQKILEVADRYLQEENHAERLHRTLMEDKVFKQLKSQLKLDVTELPYPEFMAKITEKTAHELEHHS